MNYNEDNDNDDDNIDIEELFKLSEQHQNLVKVKDNDITLESQYLQNRVLNDKTIQRCLQTQEDIFAASRFHQCTGNCRLDKLSPGQQFQFNDTICYATGEVFVCRQYCKVHLCGLRCDFDTVDTKEGTICRLTGYVIRNIYSLAQSSADPNVLITGNYTIGHTYNPHDESAKEEGGVTAKRYEKNLSNYHLLFESTEIDGKFGQKAIKNNFSTIISSSLPSAASSFSSSSSSSSGSSSSSSSSSSLSISTTKKTKTKKMSKSAIKKANDKALLKLAYGRKKKEEIMEEIINDFCGETIHDRLLKYANNNEQDVDRILSIYAPHNQSEEFLKARILERAARRTRAEHEWSNLVSSTRHLIMAEKRVNDAHDVWRSACKSYNESCYKNGEIPSLICYTTLWFKYVFKEYNNFYYGGDVNAVNQAHKKYYIECILRIWEKLRHLPSVRNTKVKFDTCCSAILRTLSTGLEQSVYTIRKDLRPRIWDDMTAAEQSIATEHIIVFIDKHEDLILAESNEVRGLHSDNYRKRASSTIKGVSSSIFNQPKKGFGTKQQITNNRKSTVHMHIMPHDKHLKSLYIEAISKSKTIIELQTYCLSNIYPKNKI